MTNHRYIVSRRSVVNFYAATLDEAHRLIVEYTREQFKCVRSCDRLSDYRVVDRWTEPGVVYDERVPKWMDLPEALAARANHPDYRLHVDDNGNVLIWRRGSITYCDGI